MATVTAIDYRRTDQRINTLANPYWITSGLVVCADADDLYALLFSFPTAGKMTMVLDVVCQIITAFTSGTTVDIGLCTLATDAVTTGGVGTTVDDDEYIPNTALTVATPGYYRAATSDWLSLRASFASQAASFCLLGAASTVPCIMALTVRTGVISAGTFRVHMLVTDIPGVV